MVRLRKINDATKDAIAVTPTASIIVIKVLLIFKVLEFTKWVRVDDVEYLARELLRSL